MDYLLVCSVALIASALTLVSGFGLGTLLMPAFAVFFPLPAAIAAAAIVHLANNLFSLGLVARYADRRVLIAFGIPATFAALLGAATLRMLSEVAPLHVWHIGAHACEITTVKLVIAAGMPIEDLAKTRSNALADYYGVEHPPLQGHDALDDALSVAYALQHLLQTGKLQPDVFER